MVKAELGTKRTCPSCAARFYDLLKNPIVCPKCGVSFIAANLLPSKGDMPGHAPPPKPREVVAEPEPVPDVELVSLEDVAAGEAEDETAAIADVDLGEEEPAASNEEDNTFLEEEEEDGSDVTGYIDQGPVGKEGEEEP